MAKMGPFVLLISVTAGCSNAGTAEGTVADVAVAKQAMVVSPQWFGDYSGCISASANRTFMTRGGPNHIGDEFDANAPDDPNAGQPGCDGAYIVDYAMPQPGTNGVDGWSWAFIHAAHQGEECGALWHNQIIFAYGKRDGEGFAEQHGDIFSWLWDDQPCNSQFVSGDPPVVVIQDSYDRIRIATQMGVDGSAGLSQLVYLQTEDGLLPDDAPGG